MKKSEAEKDEKKEKNVTDSMSLISEASHSSLWVFRKSKKRFSNSSISEVSHFFLLPFLSYTLFSLQSPLANVQTHSHEVCRGPLPLLPLLTTSPLPLSLLNMRKPSLHSVWWIQQERTQCHQYVPFPHLEISIGHQI
jgi:hypothetical protein